MEIKFYDQTWGDLEGYYRLYSANPDPDNLTTCATFDDSLKPSNGYTPDHAIIKYPGRLVISPQIRKTPLLLHIVQEQDGIWADKYNWARPEVWDYPNSSYNGEQLELEYRQDKA